VMSLIYDAARNPLRVGEVLLIKSGGQLISSGRSKAAPNASADKTLPAGNSTTATVTPSKIAKISTVVTDKFLKCPVCREKFTPTRSDAVYCSGKCRIAAFRGKQLSLEVRS
jgi:hypothetical protein